MKLDGSQRIRGQRVSVTVKADPLHVELDPEKLGEPVAEEIARAIERGIQSNPERTRDGKRRLFVRSGNLARSITVEQRGQTFAIVAPPGYLQDPAMMERLVKAVPVIEDPYRDPAVERALGDSADRMFKKGRR